jgi:uncharacterized membrane protein (DUF106 family)
MAQKMSSPAPAPAPAPASAPGAGGAPAPAGGGMSRLLTIFIFVLAIFVLFDPTLREALGTWVGYVLYPLVGFGGAYPVLTLVITGVFMAALTIVIRHFFTDYVAQAESQKIVSAFNKELRQARIDNNTFKLKKLLEMQPKILQKSMAQSTTQLKLMPVTMIIIIPIFAWVSVFINAEPSTLFAVPWAYNADLNAMYIFPAWVLLYSLISIPVGQVVGRGLRYFSFKKRLDALAAAGK